MSNIYAKPDIHVAENQRFYCLFNRNIESEIIEQTPYEESDEYYSENEEEFDYWEVEETKLHSNYFNEYKFELELTLPVVLYGKIIGKQGLTLRGIQTELGVKIVMPKNTQKKINLQEVMSNDAKNVVDKIKIYGNR